MERNLLPLLLLGAGVASLYATYRNRKSSRSAAQASPAPSPTPSPDGPVYCDIRYTTCPPGYECVAVYPTGQGGSSENIGVCIAQSPQPMGPVGP